MKKQWLACILSVVLCFSSCSMEGNFGDILQNFIPGITDQGGTGNQGGNQEDNQGGNQEDNQGGNQGNTSKENCVDKNADGVCDDCKESVIIPLSIIAVNDLHGKLLDGDNHLGVDEMSTWIKDVRAENPNTVLLSSGDMWQGGAESNLTRGKIINDWMEEMAEKYPEYGFEVHKGYGTKAHYAALTEHGATDSHRMTFLKKFYADK